MTWMLTSSGIVVEPANLKSGDVLVDDIAHHLSNLCRFTGACRQFYSVASHSLLVAEILEYMDLPELTQLTGLMHDAPEAYLADLGTPVKAQLPAYKDMERRAWRAVAMRFALPLEMPPIVHAADLVALAIERRDLMPKHDTVWECLKGIDRLPPHNAVPMGPHEAKGAFLERFHALRARATIAAAGQIA